jgi:mRNA interferase MazF
MPAAKPGDVVTYDFPAAGTVKARPAVVLSSNTYHAERPDLILGILTTNMAAARSSTDHVLLDWASVGLRAPSAFRVYFTMASPRLCRVIGHLSARDWQAIRDCVHRALA